MLMADIFKILWKITLQWCKPCYSALLEVKYFTPQSLAMTYYGLGRKFWPPVSSWNRIWCHFHSKACCRRTLKLYLTQYPILTYPFPLPISRFSLEHSVNKLHMQKSQSSSASKEPNLNQCIWGEVLGKRQVLGFQNLVILQGVANRIPSLVVKNIWIIWSIWFQRNCYSSQLWPGRGDKCKSCLQWLM